MVFLMPMERNGLRKRMKNEHEWNKLALTGKRNLKRFGSKRLKRSKDKGTVQFQRISNL